MYWCQYSDNQVALTAIVIYMHETRKQVVDVKGALCCIADDQIAQ